MRALFLSCLSLFVITGCNGPLSSMPSMYHYHTETYRFQKGEAADFVGYEYSATQNQKAHDIWRMVAVDLVNSLEDDYGVVPQHIYLVPHKNGNAFTNSYDHALRLVLLNKGYHLATMPQGVPHLYYEAVAAADYTTHEDADRYNSSASDDIDNTYETLRAKRQEEYKLVSFKLTMALDNHDLAIIKNLYSMPTYGYEDGSLYSPYLLRSPTVDFNP